MALYGGDLKVQDTCRRGAKNYIINLIIGLKVKKFTRIM